MPNVNVSAVKTGDKIVLTPDKRTFEVKAACKDKNGGSWMCLTHDEIFDNQFQKDMHICGTAVHLLLWICRAHGPEQP